MIHFFGSLDTKVFAVQTVNNLSNNTITKLQWLFGDQPKIELQTLDSTYVGPRVTNTNLPSGFSVIKESSLDES